MTNLPSLLALCGEALSTQNSASAAADLNAGTEAVKRADQYAAKTFGPDAANAFGEWLPLEVMEPDCLQAAVQITPFAVLRFTDHVEDGPSFTLFGHCSNCLHDETTSVTSMLGLATALAAVGVR